MITFLICLIISMEMTAIVAFFKLRKTLKILEERIYDTQQVVINHNKILTQLTLFYKESQDRIITAAVTKNVDRTFHA